jgi:flagellar hook protein FlgE
MSLASSLNVGVSALRAYSQGIQVVSNNISNVNTVGYKVSRAQYSDTFSNLLKPLVPNENNTAVKIAPTQVGGGVQIQAIAPVFSQGTIQTTSSNSDLAVAGNGFFRVKNPQTGQAFVTRAGNFRVDADGYMVTQQGFRVQGSIGANTKVVYDAVNGSYDVKGQQDNVKVTIPTGMRTQEITVTSKANSAVLTDLAPTDFAVLKVGMPISGGTYPSGTFVKSINGGVVTLSAKATTDATGVALQASLLSVDSESLNLVFPPDFARPALVPGMVLSGPGIEPGTTIESAIGNLKSSVPASASSVTLTGVTFTPPGSGTTTDITVDSVAGLAVGMVVSLSSGFTAGQKIKIMAINPPASGVSGAKPSITVDKVATSGLSNSSAVASGDKTLEAGSSSFRLSDVTGIVSGMRVSGDGLPAGAYVGTIVQDPIFMDYVVTLVDSKGGRELNGLNFTTPANGATQTQITLNPVSSLTVGDEVDFGGFFGPGPVTVAEVDTVNNRVRVNHAAYTPLTAGNPPVAVAKPATATGFTPKYISSSSYSAVSLGFGEQTITLNKRPNANTFDNASLSVSTQYTPASRIGDLRVSFNEGTDFTYYGTNGVELAGIPLEAARVAGPRIRTFNVGSNGQVNVILSNGQTFSSGAVLLQTFKDPGALIREGDNLFSGIFTAGPYNGEWSEENITGLTAGSGGLGSINGGALELSNVDLGEEFSTMIITQRAFQAGSRVITTADQMMEEAVNLKR